MAGIDLLSAFEGLPVTVIGDVMLDHFVVGQVDRISPEAPVPVVRFDREEYRQAITDGFYFRDRARRGYLTADQLPEAPPDAFKAASVDGDDRLSLQEEVNALLKDFEAADVNNDGALTYGELEAYVTRSRR